MHDIQTLDEFNNVIINNKHVVVDFYASWCAPCKTMMPHFENLSHQYENIYFCKVNIEKNVEVADTCDITSLPTFLFYKNKENIDELIGADKNILSQKINDLITH